MGSAVQKLVVSLILLAYMTTALELSSACVNDLVDHAVKGVIDDFLTAYNVFRVHETRICGIKLSYTLDYIDLKERKLHFTFNLGSSNHNLYYLECTVYEGVKWTYTCNLVVKPELSPNYAVLKTYKGEVTSPIPSIKERAFKTYKPCPKYVEMYKRLSFSGAFKVFPITPPSDPLGKFIVTYVNNEFLRLLEYMHACNEKAEAVAKSLYYHLDLISKLGISHSNITKIKEALVPCWTEVQCFLRSAFLNMASFYGIEVNVLGEIEGIDVNTMVVRLAATIVTIIATVKIVRKIIRSKMVNGFIESFRA